MTERLLSLNNSHLIINRHFDQLYLKLGRSIDGDGDHTAYGGRYEPSSSDRKRFNWFFIKEDNDYFKIVNSYYGSYLKLGREEDKDGDHTVYAGQLDPNDIDRFYWKITQISNNVYQIENKHFSKYIKLGFNADGEGDHTAYGGKIEPSDNRFFWIID